MRSNDDLIGQCLSNNRQVFNEHIFFDGGRGEKGNRRLVKSRITNIRNLRIYVICTLKKLEIKNCKIDLYVHVSSL